MPDADISAIERCTTRQLNELLALASSSARTTSDSLLEVGDRETLEYLLIQMREGTESGSGLLSAVCSPDTPIENLSAVKSTAKRLVMAADSPMKRAAATLLYHLAVASALAHHGRNISSRDQAGRLPLYRELAAELSDDELAAIFGKAAATIEALSQ